MKQSNRVLLFVVFAASGTLAHAQSAYKISKDLHEVSNLKDFKGSIPFKQAHLDALRRNLFFTCPSKDEAPYWVYGRNDYQSFPSIVTTDNILEIYHVFFESSLRGLEEQSLYGEDRSLTKAMLAQANRRYSQVKSTPLARAALKNVAYFGVADRLLGLNDEIVPAAKAMVTREISLIKGAKGKSTGAIFPYDLDYSQFIVRGHYTKTAKLGRYFQGMMWYGLAPFAVATNAGGRTVPATEQIQQSLLIVRDLAESGAQKRWQKIYDVTSIFAGKSNNLTPQSWAWIAKQTFGAKAPVTAYAEKGAIQRFAVALANLPAAPIALRFASGANADSVQFRFMGQRAIPDSVILQRLCAPEERPFPSPLDVFAVLGNARAKAILDANPKQYNAKGWTEYLPERAKLTAEFGKLPASQWSENLYWSWMDSLRKLPTPASPRYPAFMKSAAWEDKTLYSSLASWAELRHDTILYGLQTGAEMGDDPPPVLKGYVEPNLGFYARMSALVDQTRTAAKAAGLSDERIIEQFDAFADLLSFCRTVSEKELAGKALTHDEYMRIRLIEGDLESAHNLIQKAVGGFDTMSADDLDTALVADVHTAYGKALTVGVGRADHLYAIVPIEGKLVLTRGSTLSYYEFTVPASQRMTDQQWKKQLNAGKAPARPAWVKSFYVPIPLKGKDD